jgi:uncharacterized protein YbjQ (UPF0145 family)
LAIVIGTCVYHLDHRQHRRRVGGKAGEVASYTYATSDGRETALARLQANAAQLGADAVIAVEVSEDAHGWGDAATEYLAVGDAVRRQAPSAD